MKKVDEIRLKLNAIVSANFYESQENRKRAMNRLRQLVYLILEGKELTAKQDKKKDSEKFLDKYNDKKLLKILPKLEGKLNKTQLEYVTKIMGILEKRVADESEYKKVIQSMVEQDDLYNSFLKNIKGIGPLNTINLLRYFGYCEKAKHVSSLWKYAGLHVVDGHSPKFSKAEGEASGGFNPQLRMLMWRISDCFVKQRTPKYRKIYDNEKKRQEELVKLKAVNAPKSKLHADLRARRKMSKSFLCDYFLACLALRGIPSEPVYSHRNK